MLFSYATPYPFPSHIPTRFQYALTKGTSDPSHSLSLASSLYRVIVVRSAMKGGRSKAESKKADAKLSVKKGAATAKKPVKKGKPAKDPNKPKRPASAFFVFMEEFRKQYKEKHPNNKSVAAVGKAGGDKWKSLSEAEKAPYIAKAEKRKAEYEKKMQAYNKKTNEGTGGEEESDKSRSEVNDEDDEEDEGSAEEDEDDDE